MHLKVGDIVRLGAEDPLPADILVLASSEEFHQCQITTANLDGESDLKVNDKAFLYMGLIVPCINSYSC